MHRLMTSLVWAVVLASAVSAGPQVGAVPVALALSASQREVTAGASVIFTVTLHNNSGQPVPALADTAVALAADTFPAAQRVVIPAGQSSAQATIVLSRSGIGRVKASADRLAPAYVLVPVRPVALQAVKISGLLAGSAEALHVLSGGGSVVPPAALPTPTPARRSEAAVVHTPPTRGRAPELGARSAIMAGRAGAAGVAPPQAPPESLPAGAPPAAPAASGLGLDVEVTPDDIYPRANGWSADVSVLLTGPGGGLAIADHDVPVHVSAAHFAQVSPRDTVIHAGESSTALPIQLTSDRVGQDTVQARSTVGDGNRPVMFSRPQPAGLRIEPNPTSLVADGQAVVHVVVSLEDANHVVTSPDHDVQVTVTPSMGTLDKGSFALTPAEPAIDLTLTSTSHGVSLLKGTAPAEGLEGQGQVTLLFPWLMTALAIVGGAAGSYAQEGTGAKRKGGRKPWRHLAIGALFGLVFYGLAFFGAIGSIPRFAIAIGKIAAVNELGALVLGFIGGYGSNGLWDRLTSQGPAGSAGE